MRRRVIKLATVGMVLLIVTALIPEQSRAASADVMALGQGTADFTLNLYRQMLPKEKGNIFFSPYSISMAMAMTYGGAKGETAREMAKVLGFTLPSDKLHPALAELSKHLQRIGNMEGQSLKVANALWLKTGLKLQPGYLKLIRDYYSDEMKQLDFCQEAQSRKTINDWVADKTKNRIQDIIPERMLSCETMLVLANAIYFLGEWAGKFDKDKTKIDSFWATPDKKVETLFMNRTDEYDYAEMRGWQILELPYREKRLSMVVLLPKAQDGLAAAEKDLSPEMLADITRQLRPTPVDVSLPKFEIKTDYGLKDYLAAAGMPTAFTSGADFTGITPSNMSISHVLHKAWVNVDEKGTEAAAATVVIMEKMLRPVFKANRPFLFFIKDKETGIILFWGRMSIPKAGE